jgi:hypothetical protein
MAHLTSPAAFLSHIDTLVAQHDVRHAFVCVGDSIHREYSIKVRGDDVEADRVNVAFWVAEVTLPFMEALIQMAGAEAETMRGFVVGALGPKASMVGLSYSPAGVEVYVESRDATRHVVAYDAGKREHSSYEEVRDRSSIASVYDIYQSLVSPAVYDALVGLVPPKDCINVYAHRHPAIAVGCMFAPSANLVVRHNLSLIERLLVAASCTTAPLAALANVDPTAKVTWVGLYVQLDGGLIVKIYYSGITPFLTD